MAGSDAGAAQKQGTGAQAHAAANDKAGAAHTAAKGAAQAQHQAKEPLQQGIPSGALAGDERDALLHKLLYGRTKHTFSHKLSDWMTNWVGSWTFILLFVFVFALWIAVNLWALGLGGREPFDPYPFILLNLALSCLAAIQAPIILMSQNRQAQRDRIKAERDFAVNRRADRGVDEIKAELAKTQNLLRELHAESKGRGRSGLGE
ncbi:MAG: DUF1003 domain-containing protein [Candidatus Diapherotrites archaeon]